MRLTSPDRLRMRLDVDDIILKYNWYLWELF